MKLSIITINHDYTSVGAVFDVKIADFFVNF